MDKRVMTYSTFSSLLDKLDKERAKTMRDKSSLYSDGDILANFRSGANIIGGTNAQACWGYMSKHLAALQKKVKNNDFHDLDDMLEKCQDVMNYICFLWCIANEEHKEYVSENGSAMEPPPIVRNADCTHVSSDLTTCLGAQGFEQCKGYSECEKYIPDC